MSSFVSAGALRFPITCNSSRDSTGDAGDLREDITTRCILTASVSYTYLPKALGVDDTATTRPQTAVTIPVVNGANGNGQDSGQGGTIDLTSVQDTNNGVSAKGGTVVNNQDGTFSYTPPAGLRNGTDTFTYTECDDAAQSATCEDTPTTVTITVAASAAFTVTKTAPASAVRGQDATYTILVTNSGADSATPTVTDTLPTGLSFVSGSGTGFNACSASGQVVTCTGNSLLASSASETVDLVTLVAQNAPNPIAANTAVVTTTDASAPRATGSSATVPITSQVDLGIALTPGNFTSGGTGGYGVAVTNYGPSQTSTPTTVTTTLPTGLTLDASRSPGGGFSCSASGQNVTCTNPTRVPVDGVESFTIPVLVSPTATDTSDTVTVATGDIEPNPDTTHPNTDSASGTISHSNNLTIAKTAPSTFVAGGTGSYQIVITNAGPSSTNGAAITLTDPLPTGFTLASIDASGASGFTCSGTTTVTCTSTSTLASQASGTIRLTVNVPTSAAGSSITNTASVSSNPADSNTADNSASAVVAVPNTDLSILKCGYAGQPTAGACPSTPATFVRGNTVSYRLTAGYTSTPAGPSPAVRVEDVLPAGLTLTGITAPAGWTCSPVSNPDVVCTNPGLANGTSAVFTLTATLNQAAPGSLANTATIAYSTAGSAYESNTTNNSATVNNPVTSSSAYTVLKTSDANFVVGTTGSYSVAITDNGPSDAVANSITVTDTLPAGLTYAATTSVNWTCTGTTTLSCTYGSGLAVGATTTLTFTVNVATAAYASRTDHTVSNTASAGGTMSTKVTPVIAGSIGDLVFSDISGTGVQGPSTAGFTQPVQVTLFKGGNQLATATTVNGGYLFDGLAAGTDYQVTFGALPSGFGYSPQAGTPDTTKDSDASPASGATGRITVQAGEPNTSVDAGVLMLSSVSGEVYGDNDGSLTRNDGDTGLGGVTVTLTGTDDLGNPVSATTSSAATGTVGSYGFAGLRPSNSAGYTITEVQATVPATYRDGATAAPVGEGTAGTNTVAVVLPTGATFAPYQFGEIPPTSLSGTVFDDVDHDGLRDAGDNPRGSVFVQLLDSSGAIVASQSTLSNGTYKFEGLLPGTSYTVEVVAADGTAFTKPNAGDDAIDSDVVPLSANPAIATATTGVLLPGDNTPVDAGLVIFSTLTGQVYVDADASGTANPGDSALGGVNVTLTGTDDLGNPVSLALTTGNDGVFSYPGLRPGSYTVSEDQRTVPAKLGNGVAAAGSAGGTPDSAANTVTSVLLGGPGSVMATGYTFGEVPLAGIGDTVFLDTNGNGIQDAGEPGVAGVTVTLRDATGTAVGTATTSSDGSYLFVGLLPGPYVVTFSKLPASTAFTKPGAGSDRSKDSDAAVATGSTGTVTLAPGQIDRDIDAGLVGLTCVSGVVFSDSDGDGVQDNGERGMPGVIGTINGTDDLGATVSRTVTTDANGGWSLCGLRPGTYQAAAAGQHVSIVVAAGAQTRPVPIAVKALKTTRPATPAHAVRPPAAVKADRLAAPVTALAFTGAAGLSGLLGTGLALLCAGLILLAGTCWRQRESNG